MSLWADDQWWKEMHAPRHPAPTVSEGDALAKAFADYESTREDVARRTDPMRANSLLLAGAGLANAVKDHLVQLQVQAPVGEGLENGVSDGERRWMIATLDAVDVEHDFDSGDIPSTTTYVDALLAAGYRKPTLPSVEDVARVLQEARDAGMINMDEALDVAPVGGNSPYNRKMVPFRDWYATHLATAVLALFTQESKWHDADEPYSGTFPREFVEWREPMHAARRWLEAHDRTERAAAWDEGYEVAMHEASGDYDLAAAKVPTNPYRERGDGA